MYCISEHLNLPQGIYGVQTEGGKPKGYVRLVPEQPTAVVRTTQTRAERRKNPRYSRYGNESHLYIPIPKDEAAKSTAPEVSI